MILRLPKDTVESVYLWFAYYSEGIETIVAHLDGVSTPRGRSCASGVRLGRTEITCLLLSHLATYPFPLPGRVASKQPKMVTLELYRQNECNERPGRSIGHCRRSDFATHRRERVDHQKSQSSCEDNQKEAPMDAEE